MAHQELRDKRRHVPSAKHHWRRYPKQTLRRRSQVFTHCGVVGGKQAARMCDKALPFVCRRQPARAPFEQAHANPLLKCGEAAGDSRWRTPQFLRRRDQAASIENGQENL